MSHHVFVYGTLLFPEVAQPIAGISTLPEQATLPDYRRMCVNDRSRAKVPAILPAPGYVVTGSLYRSVSHESLAALDEFEDLDRGAYTREQVEVQLVSNETIIVHTYVAGPLHQPMLEGDWDPIFFRDHELDFYLETVVKKYAKYPLITNHTQPPEK